MSTVTLDAEPPQQDMASVVSLTRNVPEICFNRVQPRGPDKDGALLQTYPRSGGLNQQGGEPAVKGVHFPTLRAPI